jgi:hypothetical protein
MDNLHLTTSRQRELLELKDRQSIESDERERKTNLLIHSAQQLLKAEKEEVQIFIFTMFVSQKLRKSSFFGKMSQLC